MLRTFTIPTKDGDMIVQTDTTNDNYMPHPDAVLLDPERAEKLLRGKALDDMAAQFEQPKRKA